MAVRIDTRPLPRLVVGRPVEDHTSFMFELDTIQGFRQNVARIVLGRDLCHRNSFRVQVLAEPMVADRDCLGAGCHAWGIGFSQDASSLIVLEDGDDVGLSIGRHLEGGALGRDFMVNAA